MVPGRSQRIVRVWFALVRTGGETQIQYDIRLLQCVVQALPISRVHRSNVLLPFGRLEAALEGREARTYDWSPTALEIDIVMHELY